MAELKKGDRIRLTVEGRVTDPSLEDGFRFETDLDEWIIEGTVDYTVEVLEGAGYRPGSVAVSQNCTTTPAVRQADGTWHSGGSVNEWGHWTDQTVRTNRFIDVVYEPPTA